MQDLQAARMSGNVIILLYCNVVCGLVAELLRAPPGGGAWGGATAECIPRNFFVIFFIFCLL